MTKSILPITGVVLLGAVLGGVLLLRLPPHGRTPPPPNRTFKLPLGAQPGPAFPGGAGTPLFPRPGLNQPGAGPGAGEDLADDASRPALALPTDPAGEKKLKAVEEYVRQEAWIEAAQLLQALLDGADAFLAVQQAGPNGKENPTWTTLHAEAQRQLSALPAPGRTAYELVHGANARALLTEADAKGDARLLADVARRFLHTTAGAEATRRLGVQHLDRGRFALAALSFERLLDHPDADKLSPAVLFTAALALHRAGDAGRSKAVWEKLSTRAPGGLRFGDKAASLGDLQALLGKKPVLSEPAGWALFRGDASRSARTAGGDAPTEVQWRYTTAHETATQTWLRAALDRQEARGEPALPAFSPVAAGDKVIYRSHRGVHAVDLRTGKPLWQAELAGGLDTLGTELSYFPYIESWVNAHLQHNPHVLFGNSVVGTLSTDGARVYVVEDLAIPPYQNTYFYRGRPVGALEYSFAPGLTEAVYHSRLTALDLESGKVLWECGGPATAKRKDRLHPAYFLGPPLPVGSQVYGLVEKEQELRLVCLDAARGQVHWTRSLGVAPTRVLTDPARRLQAAHLAYAEGVLVCPTHAGFLLGLDLVSRSFLWAYAYRGSALIGEAPPPPGGGRGRGTPTPMPPPDLRPRWAASAPILHDGKVIFTAPDNGAIHCLNLRDGSLLWQARQARDELYVAGVSRGKVLLVGKDSCRALSLTDGKPLWQATPGVPAGMGVVGEAILYLPLRTAGKDGPAAVCAIDVDTGRVRGQTAANGGPGNLIFYQDTLLSQTAAAITAYGER
jgi:outer membrane protein assembly factor BamB